MNWLERKLARLVWKRMEGQMDVLKRWAPVIGTGVLAAAVLLRFFGLTQVADMLTSLAGATGLSDQAAVTVVELGAAVAGVAGVTAKIWSQVKKARAVEAPKP